MPLSFSCCSFSSRSDSRSDRACCFEALVLLLQLLLLVLQLLRERLRLLEQLLGAHVGAERVEHDADALGELVEERQVGLAERLEAGQLDHRLHLLLEQHRQHDDVPRRRLAEAGADLDPLVRHDVIVGHVGEQDALLLERDLPDQALALAGCGC